MAHTLKLAAAAHRADGSTYNAADQAGYVVYVDGVEKMKVSNASEIDLSSQPFFPQLAPGPHKITAASVDKYGTVSAQSAAATLVIPNPAAPQAPGISLQS